jgi:hypothetical protein
MLRQVAREHGLLFHFGEGSVSLTFPAIFNQQLRACMILLAAWLLPRPTLTPLCLLDADYPDNSVVVRTQAYNQWAKAVVISRVGGVGEIASVNFKTRNGGFTSGAKVAGWGAWWMPTSGLGGQGGVELLVTLKDGSTLNTNDYPLPDYNLWNTGNLYNYFNNIGSC